MPVRELGDRVRASDRRRVAADFIGDQSDEADPTADIPGDGLAKVVNDGFQTGAEKWKRDELVERAVPTIAVEHAERFDPKRLLFEISQLLARVVAVLEDDLDRVGVVRQDLLS